MRYSLPCYALAVAILPACSINVDAARRTVSVTGHGKAAAAPDLATVQAGVVTKADTAAEALTASNKAVGKVMATLRELQVAAGDAQTSRFDVRPFHKRDPDDGRTPPELAGYQVTNRVQVQVRRLSDLGKVLDALVRAGAPGCPASACPSPTRSRCWTRRARAIADARHRAELYAKAAGVKAGQVLTIAEQAGSLPQPRALGQVDLREATSAVPMAAGEDEVHARVIGTFALESAP